MRRKLAFLFIIIGLAVAGWNGFAWATESSSGRASLEENDIVEVMEAVPDEAPDVQAAEDQGNEEANQELDPPTFTAPKEEVNEEEPSPEPRDYEEYEKGEEIGWLMIPALDMKYPVYWGTDDDTLKQGVGYHEGDFTTPPDGMRHTVLSGHRDTVFREMGDLEEGDKMYVQFEDIQYEYEIQKTWITDAEDRTVIVDKEEPTLTLTTCYPFNFIGPAPDRYIIEAPLTNTTEIN
ncbi:class D sortase [Alkalicoccus daliensis]|uniref:Sortase A n=1 Tax=Alkalicoccus daliensis TaxID=745820 RepID=A0A1H0ITL5_9BACI|nr:class D sortase [Alkalicoccus daliensis]SDO34787.1 sortase A [Alkalicoccus daliensis]